jgi:hypothetical protein
MICSNSYRLIFSIQSLILKIGLMIDSYDKTGPVNLPSAYHYPELFGCPLTFDLLLNAPLYFFNPYNYPSREIMGPFK